MSNQYKRIREHAKYADNPFLDKVIENVKITKRKEFVHPTNKAGTHIVVDENGEVTGHTQFLQLVEVDEQKFAKVYLSQFEAFWELTKPAIRVFGYIMQVVKPNSDRFIFKIDEAKKYADYKNDSSIFSGLACLIEQGIIARTKYDFEYFINPLIFFNGDRVTFAKMFIKKKEEQIEGKKQVMEIAEGNETPSQTADLAVSGEVNSSMDEAQPSKANNTDTEQREKPNESFSELVETEAVV